MPQIETFVFFDIETTGLPGCNPPKIIELAFVACPRNILLGAIKDKIPRVTFKLLIPLNPYKLIHYESTWITGLDNFMLEHLKKFDKNTVDLINNFLNQLNKPICLVAHNGNKFDYPILRSQLQKLTCSLDEDLLCVDSLPIFQKIEENKPGKSVQHENLTTTSALDDLLNTDLYAVQNKNEKTPSKRTSYAVYPKKPDKKKCLPRQLFATETNSSNTSDVVSYKLTEIYKRLHERIPIDSHNAEADTIHLFLCAIAVKNEFVRIADTMAIKFLDAQFSIA